MILHHLPFLSSSQKRTIKCCKVTCDTRFCLKGLGLIFPSESNYPLRGKPQNNEGSPCLLELRSQGRLIRSYFTKAYLPRPRSLLPEPEHCGDSSFMPGVRDGHAQVNYHQSAVVLYLAQTYCICGCRLIHSYGLISIRKLTSSHLSQLGVSSGLPISVELWARCEYDSSSLCSTLIKSCLFPRHALLGSELLILQAFVQDAEFCCSHSTVCCSRSQLTSATPLTICG